MRRRISLTVLGLTLFLTSSSVAMTGCGDPSGPRFCTQPDIDQPCTGTVDTASKTDITWNVTVHVTKTYDVEYTEAGHVCSRHVVNCVEKKCQLRAMPTSWTSAEAINACRRIHGGT